MTYFFLSSADAKQPSPSRSPVARTTLLFLSVLRTCVRLPRRRARTFRIFLPGFSSSSARGAAPTTLLFLTLQRRTILRVVVTAEFVGTIAPRVWLLRCWTNIYRDPSRGYQALSVILFISVTHASHETRIFVTRSCVIVFLPSILESLCTNAPCIYIRCSGKEERSRGLTTVMFYLRYRCVTNFSFSFHRRCKTCAA